MRIRFWKTGDEDDDDWVYLMLMDNKKKPVSYFDSLAHEVQVVVLNEDKRCSVEDDDENKCGNVIKKSEACAHIWVGQYSNWICKECLKAMYDNKIKRIQQEKENVFTLLDADISKLDLDDENSEIKI